MNMLFSSTPMYNQIKLRCTIGRDKTKRRRHIFVFFSLALLSACSFISCRPEPPAILLFNANPSEINSGESTTLKWSIKDATSVTIDQSIGEVAAAGSLKVSPAKTIAYTLTATNTGGAVSKSVVINVNVPIATPPSQPSSFDTTPPTMKNILATPQTDTSAIITWTTSEPSSSLVEYDKTAAYGLSVNSNELTTNHTITLTGLEPNTEYYYRIESTDKAGNEASSADNTFITLQEKSSYSLALISLEWERKSEGGEMPDLGTNPVDERKSLFVKCTLQNKSQATLRAIICTMNCWSGNNLAKYEVYVHRAPNLPGQIFTIEIKTADDPTVDNVTVDFADSMGRTIDVITEGQ